ncbi:MAG: aminotransferase class V-fold PLP-dependent enzyme, partial [Planctomycetota bacterium]
YANNETGVIEPISEIGKVAKEKSVLFHTDAVQAAGKIRINVNELNVDLLSLSGHKMYGPKGIGALYIRKGTKIEPLMHGGHHEMEKRAGTENVPGIVGLGRAMEIAIKELENENNRLTYLRDKLWNNISKNIDSVYLNGHPVLRLPNTASIAFEYVESESIILNLDLKGIAVSGGSACASGSLEPSHVLSAMGIEASCAQGSIRFSLGKDNPEQDIDYLVEVLPPIVSRLRDISPLYKKTK